MMAGVSRLAVIAMLAIAAWGIMWIFAISALLVLNVLSFADIGNTLMEMFAL